jgi:hypothetical protein
MSRPPLVRVSAALLGAVLLTAPVAAFAERPGAGDSGKLKNKTEITFTGYRTLPGNRGLVFVELTEAVTVEVSRSGQVIEYKLLGAIVPLRNNKNALLLADFNGSALSARLVADRPGRGKGAKGHAKQPTSTRLVITLRGSVSPTYRMVPHGKGAVLEVELPPLPTK